MEEEEREMFVKVRKAKIDVVSLGQQMQQRKQELMQESESGLA